LHLSTNSVGRWSGSDEKGVRPPKSGRRVDRQSPPTAGLHHPHPELSPPHQAQETHQPARSHPLGLMAEVRPRPDARLAIRNDPFPRQVDASGRRPKVS
jgi:hypothetical protein